MVQDILSAMESDEVNSIGDTVEGLQVAQEIKTSFEALFNNYEWPSNDGLISLSPSNDPDQPTVMTIPDEVNEIYWIKYNQGTLDAPEIAEVRFQDPELFFRYGTVYANGQSPVQLVGDFYVRTDTHPQHWTTFDNNKILFDSYNSSVDSTLQESKVICWGRKTPGFVLADDFIPPIDSALFPVLLSEAKRMCFVNFKGVSNANEERRARDQKVRLQRHLWRARQRQPFNGRTTDYSRRR